MKNSEESTQVEGVAAQRSRGAAFHILRTIKYAVAFLSIPILVGAAGMDGMTKRLHSHAAPFSADLTPPAHDPEKPTAVVLLSNVWTEATDFLGPYEVLSASDAYNVYAVAPERVLTPLNGAVDVIPHYSMAEFGAAGLQADVMVVPYISEIHGEANRPLLEWIAAHGEDGGTILSICAGAEVVAASGALEGHRATTIWSMVDALERQYPETEWVRDVRYVDDGSIISSAGVTSGIDATFYLLKREVGEAEAFAVAKALNYPHTRFMNDPAQPVEHGLWDIAAMGLHAAYQWDRPTLGVAVQPGVTELELASIADTYTPAVARIATVAEERRPVETAHGLHVVPRHDVRSAPKLDRLIVPGTEGTLGIAWTSQAGVPVATPHAELAAEGSHYAFDAITMDLAEAENPAVARATAASIEYPIEHLELPAEGRLLGMVVRPFALGLLGVALLFGLEGGVKARRGRRASIGPSMALRRSPTA